MNKRVLVVENDKSILEIIGLVLEEEGYTTSLHNSEGGILEKITAFEPDIIVLDIFRPTLESTELCRQLKAAQATAHIPVIALSTHPEINKVKEICADDVVPKTL
jgi:CheY-like chemotaxis protein